MDGINLPNPVTSVPSSRTPLSTLAPGAERIPKFAVIAQPGEEEPGPLTEIGVTPDDIVTSEGRVNYLHPGHWKSGALWAYVVIVIIVAIIIFYLIWNQQGRTWYETLTQPGSLPFSTLITIWIIFLVLLIIVGYVGHVEAVNEARRLHLTWAFIINLIILILWALFFFHQRDLRATFFLSFLTLVAAIWWTIVMWPVNAAMTVILIVYVAWLFYLVWVSRQFFLTNTPIPNN